jgi:hypothetical protein
VPKEFLSFMRRKRSQFFMNMATSLAACVVTTCGCFSPLFESEFLFLKDWSGASTLPAD